MAQWLQSEVGRRAVAGVSGAVVMIFWILYGGRIGISVMALLLAFGAAREYSAIVFQLEDKKEKMVALIGMVWLIAFVNFLVPRAEYELLIISFLGLFSYFLVSAEKYKERELVIHFRELTLAFFGILYTAMIPLYLPLIYSESKGSLLTLLFFLIVFCGDTGAFFVGRKWGKRKLYPEISPNKTLEGALGGLGCSLLITLIAKLTFLSGMSWLGVIFMPPLVGAIAQVGDFCESFLKRSFVTKDSGAFLPGHGGILDRFDGVLFGLPVMYACVRILT